MKIETKTVITWEEGDVVGGDSSIPPESRSYYRRNEKGVWNEFPWQVRDLLDDAITEHVEAGRLVVYPVKLRPKS